MNLQMDYQILEDHSSGSLLSTITSLFQSHSIDRYSSDFTFEKFPTAENIFQEITSDTPTSTLYNSNDTT